MSKLLWKSGEVGRLKYESETIEFYGDSSGKCPALSTVRIGNCYSSGICQGWPRLSSIPWPCDIVRSNVSPLIPHWPALRLGTPCREVVVHEFEINHGVLWHPYQPLFGDPFPLNLSYSKNTCNTWYMHITIAPNALCARSLSHKFPIPGHLKATPALAKLFSTTPDRCDNIGPKNAI